jgi:hypothetical protein
MTTDDRDILEVLRAELDFIEKGGYGRSVRTPWQPKASFLDSLTCINYADPEHTSPCTDCQLIDFVPPEKRSEQVPCHFVPLNAKGDTIEELEADDQTAKLEKSLKAWLKAKIQEIEEQRLAEGQSNQVSPSSGRPI